MPHFYFSLRLILIIIVCILISRHAKAQPEIQKAKQTKINDELYYNRISDDVYLITHYFPYWGGNSLVVLLQDKQAVLIDTPYDGAATESLLDWITSSFGDLQLHAIVTGFHQDNLGGNELLIKRNIPVYGMDLTAQLVKSEGESFKKVILESVENHENKMYFERFEALVLTPPNHIIDLKKGSSEIIEIGSKEFEFFYPGETHTADNSVVYIHENELLFGGCMIRAMADTRPGYIAYANMDEWPVSVELVLKKFPRAKIVVPGHGFEGNFELLQHTIDILNEWNNGN